MSVSKIKNLILLILVLSVIGLLALVIPTRLSQAQEEEALHAQLEELFASYDIQLDRNILPHSVNLYAIELTAQKEDSAKTASALLGADATLRTESTHYASTYSGENGTCTLRSDGGFSAALTNADSSSDLSAASMKLLKKMGFDVGTLSSPQRQSAGVYALTASQTLLGVPVLSDGLTLTYSNGALSRLQGDFFVGSSQISRISESSCGSCADALTSFLSARDALGWVGSQILSVRQYYRHSESASASVRLTPVWIIETDTGSFCVNGLSREVTVWETEISSE